MTERLLSLWNWLLAGGPVVMILAALSVVALATVIVKLVGCARMRLWHRRPVDRALHALSAGRPQEACHAVARLRTPVAAPLRVALDVHLEGGRPTAERLELAREEAEGLARAALARLGSGLGLLSAIATVAPLLGLLGTVLGMIEAFRALEAAGNQVDPGVLSGGIWEALLTTALGLIVAIPASIAATALHGLVTRQGDAIDDALMRVFTHRAPAAHAQAGAGPGGRNHALAAR